MPILNYTTESYGGLMESCEEKGTRAMIRTRLRRLRDKDTRKLIAVILAGKMLGIVAMLLAVKAFGWYFGSQASAATLRQVAVKADDIVNPINTVWTLVTAFLVFFMQAGFMGLEAGFARSRETVNVLLEGIFDPCLCGLLYWAFGFTFQFGTGTGVVGFIALAGAMALGARLGRTFKRDGGGPLPPHDLTWGAIGGVILWFGWYGFNPGSTLSAMDFAGIGRIAANTTIAACAAGMAAVLWAYPRSKKWDLGISVNGFLGGLVAITCPCYWVSPFGAVVIGAVAGVVVIYGIDLLEHWRIDDPIGAVPVHGFAGIWVTLSLGLLATDQ